MRRNAPILNDNFDIWGYIQGIRKNEVIARRKFEKFEEDEILFKYLKDYERKFGIPPENPVWQTQTCYCCGEEYLGVAGRHNFCGRCGGVYQSMLNLREKIKARL